MKLSDIQRKDIVILATGIKIGKIIDADFDIESGKIISFTLEKKNIKNIFKSEENIIKFTDITKIGKDVILINSLE